MTAEAATPARTAVARADAQPLPAGWRMVRFGDVVRDVKVSVDPSTAGLERYVAGEHMETDDLHIRQWGTVGDGYLGPAFHRKFLKGQVLYGSRRTYLRKVAVADFDGICANTTFVLEPATDELLPELLPFVMSTAAFHEHSVRESRGSVNPYIIFRDIAWYEFPLPPLEEQRRIADILWAADRSQQQWQRVADGLATLRDALRRRTFPEGAPNPAWHYGRFDSICTEASQNGVTVPKDLRSGHIGLVNMGEIFRGEIVPLDGLAMVDLRVTDVDRYLLRTGDLLFARRSIVLEGAGKCSIVPGVDMPVTFESSIIRVSVDRSRGHPRFYWHFFNSPGGKRLLRTITRRGAIAGIAGSDLRRIEVPIPSLREQTGLVEQLDACDAPLAAAHRQCEAMRTLRTTVAASLLAPSFS